MRHSVARIKGLGFLLWHAKHELVHILLGLLWAWYLRERWGEFNLRWIAISIFGSLLPDIDHVIYWFTYGRNDWYSQEIRKFLRSHQWRELWVFVEKGHKSTTNLMSHNYFVMIGFCILALVSSFYDVEAGVILFGAMFIHYVFDIVDDLLMLGHLNPNWKRWGRKS